MIRYTETQVKRNSEMNDDDYFEKAARGDAVTFRHETRTTRRDAASAVIIDSP